MIDEELERVRNDPGVRAANRLALICITISMLVLIGCLVVAFLIVEGGWR